jgi:hypothetical protein
MVDGTIDRTNLMLEGTIKRVNRWMEPLDSKYAKVRFPVSELLMLHLDHLSGTPTSVYQHEHNTCLT